MHIKEIRISGFRSYLNLNELRSLSPKLNVILGRNGSGKSNVFHAIQFVLGDEFAHLEGRSRSVASSERTQRLGYQQRRQLLFDCDVSKQRTMQAWVEIVLDNSDNRIHMDLSTITIRRVIGLKKDQFFVNGKSFTPQDIAGLLEMAGFTRSNPYYIVRQGKINELTTSSDGYRLNILREVAGTRVYDDKQIQVSKDLDDANGKMKEIESMLIMIEEKIYNINEHMGDYKSFKKCDKKRRSIEYFITLKEMDNAKLKKEDIERNRDLKMFDLEKDKDALNKQREDAKVLKENMKRINDDMMIKQTYLSQVEVTIDEYSRKLEQIGSNMKMIQYELQNEKSVKSDANQQLEQLNKEIGENARKLKEIRNQYLKHKDQEEEQLKDIAIYESRLLKLREKQSIRIGENDKRRFTNKRERDAFIVKELTNIKTSIVSKERQIRELENDKRQQNDEKNKLQNEIKIRCDQESVLRERMKDMKSQIESLIKNRKTLETEQRNQMTRFHSLCDRSYRYGNDEPSLKQKFITKIGKSNFNSLNSVNTVLDIFRHEARAGKKEYESILNGYYGPLIDLFKCDDRFNLPIEVTVGQKKLFTHVVESETVSRRILSKINELHLSGDINFVVRSLIRVKEINYPDSTDAKGIIVSRKLLDHIQYDETLSDIMDFFFGRILLCRDISVGTNLARMCRTSNQNRVLEFVTFDGEKVSSTGSLTGGYYDTSNKSSFVLFKEWNDLQNRIKKTIDERNKINVNIEQNRTKIDDLTVKINSLTGQMNQEKLNRILDEKIMLKKSLTAINDSIALIDKRLINMKEHLKTINSNRDLYEDELNNELLSQLSEDDQNQIEQLNKTIEQMKKKCAAVTKMRINVENKMKKIQMNINERLNPRRDDLSDPKRDVTIHNQEIQFANEESEYEIIDAKVEDIRHMMDEKNAEIDALQSRYAKISSEYDAFMTKYEHRENQLKEESQKLGKYDIKIKNLNETIKKCAEKLDYEIGTIPGDAIHKYSDKSLKQLYHEMEMCKRELSQYTGKVNQKAIDQLNEFCIKKENLEMRKKELDDGLKEIINLRDQLKEESRQAIVTTFKQVSLYFRSIFKEFVPDGDAQLIMVTDNENGSQQSSQQSQNTESSGGISEISCFRNARAPLPADYDTYIGITIKVSFTASDVEMKELKQLSGGQKTMVAIALIFAIQQCDPAPFYVFDEIDAALDEEFRQKIAQKMNQMSEKSQFIATTFRHELLQYAQSAYGVSIERNISNVKEITKEEAKEFLEMGSDD